MSVGFNSVENSCNPIVIRATRQIPSSPVVELVSRSPKQFPGNRNNDDFRSADKPPVTVALFHTIVMAYSGYERDSVPSGIQSPGMESTHPK